jgi:hypothetical protein
MRLHILELSMSSFINSVFSFRNTISSINGEEIIMSEETLFVDSTFTADELETLNMEVTPEIEAALYQLCLEKAEKEIKEWELSRFEINQARDHEKVLNQIVDLQERMTRGMVMIKSADKIISAMWEKNTYAGFIWACWSGRITGDKARTCLSHPNNQLLISWFNRRAQLWAQWNKLQAECMELVGEDTWLWAKYFELVDSDINTYLTSGIDEDDTETDERVCNDSDSICAALFREYQEEQSYEPTMKVGYWDYSYERRLYAREANRLARQQEEQEYMASFDAIQFTGRQNQFVFNFA